MGEFTTRGFSAGKISVGSSPDTLSSLPDINSFYKFYKICTKAVAILAEVATTFYSAIYNFYTNFFFHYSIFTVFH